MSRGKVELYPGVSSIDDFKTVRQHAAPADRLKAVKRAAALFGSIVKKRKH